MSLPQMEIPDQVFIESAPRNPPRNDFPAQSDNLTNLFASARELGGQNQDVRPPSDLEERTDRVQSGDYLSDNESEYPQDDGFAFKDVLDCIMRHGAVTSIPNKPMGFSSAAKDLQVHNEENDTHVLGPSDLLLGTCNQLNDYLVPVAQRFRAASRIRYSSSGDRKAYDC